MDIVSSSNEIPTLDKTRKRHCHQFVRRMARKAEGFMTRAQLAVC